MFTVGESVCVCENVHLPVNEYMAHVRQIPIVSRKISDRDGNMRGRRDQTCDSGPGGTSTGGLRSGTAWRGACL